MKKTILYSIAFLFLALTAVTCRQSGKQQSAETSETSAWYLDPSGFRQTINGKATDLYRLANQNGMEVYVTNFGCVIPAMLVPDQNGRLDDVVLGFDQVEKYAGPEDASFGCVVGRYANRIDGGRFELDGETYQLTINEEANQNALHSGPAGFSERVWDVTEVRDQSITLELLSEDGDSGFPGEMKVSVTYELTDRNALEIHYRATTDAPTVLNLTQHSYFNLNGEGEGDILGHELMINADRFTPVNRRLIPTGEIASVEGTPMDFRTPTPIGARINEDFEQLVFGNGYDHNWVINRESEGLALAATVYAPESGRMMEVYTTEPGVQFYAGNFLNGRSMGKSGVAYQQRTGLCLETQHYPDSPNQPGFPSTTLRPGETYTQQTVYQFKTR